MQILSLLLQFPSSTRMVLFPLLFLSRTHIFVLSFFVVWISICSAVSLYQILLNFTSTKSVDGAYASAGELICMLCTWFKLFWPQLMICVCNEGLFDLIWVNCEGFLLILEFLEVIHGAIGMFSRVCLWFPSLFVSLGYSWV